MDKEEAREMNKAFHTSCHNHAMTTKYGRLFEKYPEVFKTQESMPALSFYLFGFECDNGWYDIIEKIAKVINKELKKYPEIKKDFVVSQIKEKYGTLRFSIYACTKRMYKAIEKGERKSAKTCEKCGKRGKLRSDDGWLVTLCKKHYKEWKS